MYFHKYRYAANFEFVRDLEPPSFKTARGAYRLQIQATRDDIYHLRITGKGWRQNHSEAGLRLMRPVAGMEGGQTRLQIGDGTLRMYGANGGVLLASWPGRFFGQCGESSMFEFARRKDDRFYGLGEKWSGFEHSGKITKFWNTDVWADFHKESYVNGTPAADPTYVSIPYLIVKRANTFIGLLLDNPYATFISTGFQAAIANQLEVGDVDEEFADVVSETIGVEEKHRGRIELGAEKGQPSLYILYGPTLPELTRKLQMLVGTTPLPPAWSLGYHQCRWGYQSAADLEDLDHKFQAHGIPADGLWLDIDYMDGYRVFTFDAKHFPKPAATLKKMEERGRKIVPIIDPGVKRDPGYAIYQRGKEADAFCRNPQGGEYVGLVWPGQTVFPDFSSVGARAWWAREVEAFARLGVHGAWLDMNDPSTGPSDSIDMLFDRGTREHAFYHNQYALGMAAASRQGFLAARPCERPFLLCRSGSIGSNRYTAIWTGDNYSNYHHLRTGISTTLNLALSGVPFNAPDVGGFGGDTTTELISYWYKACFLFPFFRNHSSHGTRAQEPWAFGPAVMRRLRKYIRLRYRLRPYLYQLFAEHESTGEAILRPLFYDFEERRELPLALIDDQFMVGAHIMQAPFVEERARFRTVALPGTGKWYDLSAGKWLRAGRKVKVAASVEETPIYVRDGSLLPLARLAPEDSMFDGGKVDFHVFLAGPGEVSTRYVFDDGISFGYQAGERSSVMVTARRSGDTLEVSIDYLSSGFGKGDFTFSTAGDIENVFIEGAPARRCIAQGVSISGARWNTWQAASSRKGIAVDTA
jgi:alpha-glucosidase